MNRTKISALAIGLALVFAGSSANAAPTYIVDNTSPVTIPGLTGFTTLGDMMDGMKVTAVFSNSFTQTLSWADTGVASGGVTGTGWSLSLAGDTFSSNWVFTNTTNSTLTNLVLEGLTGFTVFDRTNPSTGTPNSARGLDFIVTSVDFPITVTYSSPVKIGANAIVGDLFQKVSVLFDGGGIAGRFTFMQDTDNDSRLPPTELPEPGSIALLGLGLIGFAAARRRKSA